MIRWALFRHYTPPAPSDDSVEAQRQADRALRDAKAMTHRAEEMSRRAAEIADSLRATRERNHVAEAVMRAIRGA